MLCDHNVRRTWRAISNCLNACIINNYSFMLNCVYNFNHFSRGLKFRGLSFRGLKFRGLSFRGLRSEVWGLKFLRHPLVSCDVKPMHAQIAKTSIKDIKISFLSTSLVVPGWTGVNFGIRWTDWQRELWKIQTCLLCLRCPYRGNLLKIPKLWSISPW